MADLQSWRRHTQLAKPTENICYGHMTDFAPSDDTSCSTSPGADEKKLRPPPTRSLASFASYLGTHRRNVCPNSRPEGPSIDWPNVNGVNDKDSVYKPDIELMCTTITQSVLANPYADLPAHYNTFLLRLIEAYHQAKADLQELQMKLAEETECKQTTVDEFHGAIPSWPLARARMPQSSENASSNTLHTTVVTGPIEEAITAKLREYSFTIHTSKSSIDYDNVGQKPRQAEKPRSKSFDASRRRCADLIQHRSVIN